MFTSLKHPVRRRILRMLNDKPMAFMEMVELIGVSSSHLTYHLESLGELVYKMEDGRYRLSSFGKATVSAMKGVEEAPELETRRPKKMAFKWKASLAALLVAVLFLSVFVSVQYGNLTQLSASHDSLSAENQQLLSWGFGTNKVADILRDIVQIDTNQYKITLLSNTLEYRSDIGVTEEVIKYTLTDPDSSDVQVLATLDVNFRFRENHLSRYQLIVDENTTPLLKQYPSSDVLQAAKDTLNRYKTYSGEGYLDDMAAMLESVNQTEDTTIVSGNMKLQVTMAGGNAEFLWMYTERGIDFSAKSLKLAFQNRVLTGLIDGYFLFTVGNADLNLNQDQAITVAKNYVKTLVWTIDGKQTSGFNPQQVVSAQLLPHPHPKSAALVPYWYIVLQLDKTYPGGINQATVGIYGDTGEVSDIQMLSG